jgi:hypothetical protein
MSKYPQVYENEDGEFYAPIEDFPAPSPVAQQYADATGMIVSFEVRIESATCSECECSEPHDACPDGKWKRSWRRLWRERQEPCRFRTGPAWKFFTSDDPADFEGGESVWYPRDEQGRTLILGHRYDPDDWRHVGGYTTDCTKSEQEHYLERIQAPGQTAAFAESPNE